MMCLIRYRIGDSPERVKLYTNYWELNRDQFSPEYEIINSMNFSLSSRDSYKEQQAVAQGIAQRLRSVDNGTLTHSEYMLIAERLQHIAKKTGTIKLFKKAGLLS